MSLHDDRLSSSDQESIKNRRLWKPSENNGSTSQHCSKHYVGLTRENIFIHHPTNSRKFPFSSIADSLLKSVHKMFDYAPQIENKLKICLNQLKAMKGERRRYSRRVSVAKWKHGQMVEINKNNLFFLFAKIERFPSPFFLPQKKLNYWRQTTLKTQISLSEWKRKVSTFSD